MGIGITERKFNPWRYACIHTRIHDMDYGVKSVQVYHYILLAMFRIEECDMNLEKTWAQN